MKVGASTSGTTESLYRDPRARDIDPSRLRDQSKEMLKFEELVEPYLRHKRVYKSITHPLWTPFKYRRKACLFMNLRMLGGASEHALRPLYVEMLSIFNKAAFSQSKLQVDVVTMTTFNGMRMQPISVEWCKLISN